MMDASNRWLLVTLLFGVFGFVLGTFACFRDGLGDGNERRSLGEAIAKGGCWNGWSFLSMWERLCLLAFTLGCALMAFLSRFHEVGKDREKENEERREERLEHHRGAGEQLVVDPSHATSMAQRTI